MEGNVEGRVEVSGRRGRRRRKLLDDRKKTRGYWKLEQGALYRTLWRRRCGREYAVPLQAWSGPDGSRKLRFPDYMKTPQDGGKVVSPTHRPPLPPGNAPGTHFC